jgi:trimeric autotransporter adhesin
MKTAKSYSLNLALAALLVLASATITAAAAGNDTCFGTGADIGSTCTPLTNTTSGNNANTALGDNTLGSNTTGSDNTAVGAGALFFNTDGSDNTATGLSALIKNTTGINNTATGSFALGQNITGGANTAIGMNSLMLNSDGTGNTASGLDALASNTGGGANTADGDNALNANTTGNSNIAIGSLAGGNLTTGDNNIDIFDPGVAGESNTIRIGTQGTQTATIIAGIFGGPKIKKGCDVIAESNGLLGCMKSSARYKHQIRDMGDASDKLMKLRPVIFQYKDDSDRIQQYGLIAEEVQKVYPELVVEGDDGRPETVEYQVLPAMLLNELQKEVRENDRQTAQIAQLSRQIEEMKASREREIAAMRTAFEERISKIERQMAARDAGRNITAAFNR